MSRSWISVVLMLLCSCGQSQGERVVLTGSSTIAPLMAEIGLRFEAAHPGVRVEVQTGGSSRGIADARSGVADLGMVSRSLRADEDDLRAFAIGRDGVALIVHKDNPIASLDKATLAAIYRGQHTRWAAPAGLGLPLTVVHKADGRATQVVFLAYIGLRTDEVKPQVVIGDNEQGVKTVAGNPGAIGYVSIGAAEVAAKRGVSIKLLPIEGIEPTMANLRAGRYPIARTLHLVAAATPAGRAGSLLEFAQSAAVDDLVMRMHFAPIAR